jgi:C1A family cysteine protease
MKLMEPAMGWIKDYPDMRDFSPSTEKPARVANSQPAPVKTLLKKVGINGAATKKAVPKMIDLRQWCSPIDDQGNLGSCTAHAGTGVVEYYQRRAFGKHVDGSRLFLYKTTRNLLNWKGDTGAYLRTTMASLAMFGTPLEKYWPYDVGKYEAEPSSFVYAMAQSFQAGTYYRLDPLGSNSADVLASVKTHLQKGLPVMFGFTCYSSLNNAMDGKIPFPNANEKVVGGHAVVAVGYADDVEISNGKEKTKGALLIRNSWGTGWGMDGYGYLPYAYVLGGLAADFWVLIKSEWIDTGYFGLT